MKVSVLKMFLFICIVFASGITKADAQDITGIWRGYFVSEGNDQYKIEVQIKQSGKNGLTCVTYAYLNKVFYGKATATGFFNTAAKTAMIQEIKTVELRMATSSVACIMKYFLNYSTSGNEKFLEGVYSSKYEKTDKSTGAIKGGGCGGGQVFLRKVALSDFYVEPFLRDTPEKAAPPVQETKPTPKPTPQKETKKAEKPAAPIQEKVEEKELPKPAEKPVIVPPVVKVEPKKDAPKPIIIPQTTRSRKNELTQTLNLKNEDITVRIYDNGVIDDDTISVYLDNALVLSHKRLSTAPITLNLKLNPNNPEHILVLVAENMGRIPPNTSLMIVYDGDNRYQVRITSTEQTNAMVRLRYVSEDD